MSKFYVSKLRTLNEAPANVGMPEMAKVMAMLLADYEPWSDELGKPGGEVYYTSKDLQVMLEDIATISIDDIAKIMLYLGYELDFIDTPTWKMWKREETLSLEDEN